MNGVEILNHPLIQTGFFGVCLLLLGIIYWLIQRLLDLTERNTAAFTKNSDVISQLEVNAKERKDILNDIKAALLSRPCMKGEL
jgi:hypothetical protein